jgi:alcohol dehydrogenase
MQRFDFHPSTRVIFGENSLRQLGTIASELNGRRILLVTDPGILAAGHVDHALESLRERELEVFVFSDVEENPTTRHVEEGVRFAQAHSPVDLIIGFGGGSAMDVAKGINFLLTSGGKMEDYWGIDKAPRPMLPSIGIPTTAGTGSEAQSFALIAQEGTHRKMACGDKKARFRAVILDPVVTASMPRMVTAVSGIDAITHSVESFVCTARNPFSQMFSTGAWRLLEPNYEIVLADSQNLSARADMLLGAHFAGMAIEYSMLGAAHACANPLTMHFGVLHGVAVGLMLPHVIRWNSTAAGKLYEQFFKSPEHLIERVRQLATAGALPTRLRDCGVKEDSIHILAKDAAEQWTGKHNPRPLTEKDFVNLYESAF